VSRTDAAGQTVLVTGATGFTGGYLIDALNAAGFVTYGTVQRHEAERYPTFVQADLLNASSISKLISRYAPNYIIHLAAISFVAHGSAEEIYRTNILGTRNLLEAAAACGSIKRVILASSGNIYGPASLLPINEQAPLFAMNDYAVSKIAMEQLANLYCSDFSISIIRPFNYTGVGQSDRFLVPKIVNAFRCRQDVLELGNLDVSRDISDVRDIAAAYVMLLACEPTGIVNLCSGSEISLRSIIAACAEMTGHMPEIRANPDFTRANDVARLVGDNSKLRSLMPAWSARPFAETLDWMLTYAK